MILPFSTQLNGKPTHFVEKIWEGFLQLGIKANAMELLHIGKNVLPKDYVVRTHKPKRHSIRADKKNRWKTGATIHFFINSRTKDMLHFAPRIPVISTQKIEIKEMIMTASEFCWKTESDKIYIVKVDDRKLRTEEIMKLAVNDGFDQVDDFFNWFSEDFVGKIIHWTDLKY